MKSLKPEHQTADHLARKETKMNSQTVANHSKSKSRGGGGRKPNAATARKNQQRAKSPDRMVSPPNNECQKCRGLLVSLPGDLPRSIEQRCVNCGWQPKFGMRVVTESAEAKALRRRTAEFFVEPGTLPSRPPMASLPSRVKLGPKELRIARNLLSSLMRETA